MFRYIIFKIYDTYDKYYVIIIIMIIIMIIIIIISIIIHTHTHTQKHHNVALNMGGTVLYVNDRAALLKVKVGL